MKTPILKLIYLVAFYLFFVSISFGQNQKYHRISASITPQKLEFMLANGLEADHFSYENKLVFTGEVSDSDVAIFKKNKVKFVYLIQDLEKNLAKHNLEIDKKASKNAKVNVTTPVNFALGTYAGYYTFAQMQTILDQMRALFPNLITAKSNLGNTVNGNPMLFVKISDNPDVDEAEPEIFFNALHHAREPIGMSQMIFFMWHILENYNTDADIKTLVNSTELYLVPCVNPDGYIYNQTTTPNGGGLWRKNRRSNSGGSFGADLNRNYGYKWAFDNSGSSPTQSSETYRGPSAFSENETKIMRDFCNAHNFSVSMDFHAYGNYCIYPYGHVATNNNPEIPLFQQMSTFLTAENGFVFGNSQQTLAYLINGGGSEWRYGEQTTKPKTYAFLPEIGTSTDGFWPASSRIIPLSNTTIEMNKKIFKMGTFFGKATPNGSTTLSTTNGTIAYSFQNFSVKPATYTVTIGSNSPYVTSVGAAKTYTSPALLATQQDNITFTLDPSTPVGTIINFDLIVDNGLSPQTTSVSITYNCAAPTTLTTTAVGLNSATFNWAAVAGSSNYYVSYKENSSSTYGSEILVSGATTYNAAGLAEGTTYNWRVRSETCSNYSTVANFTTLITCAAPLNLASTNITNTAATVSWASVASASNYSVEYKLASSSTWLSAASATASTSLTITSLVASSLYDWQVKANCPSGMSNFSAGQFTTAGTPPVTYCASKGNNIAFMWIDFVALGSINRTSGADAGYYNGTALTTNVARGSTQTITFSSGFTSTIYRQYWRVWIDFNGNGLFTDAGEQVVNTNVSTAGNITATFTIPSTANLGSTRMRISSKNGSYPTPCQSFTYGEVEDFTLNITVSGARISGEVSESNEQPESSEKSIIIAPNPVGDFLQILLDKEESEPVKLKINAINGQIIFKETKNAQSKSIQINTKSLQSGFYFLNLEFADRRNKTLKFFKE